MTKTQSFAKRELDILVAQATDPDNRPIIEPFIPEILALCEKFGNSGQSGGSAPYTAGAIAETLKKLLLQDPICPITGYEEEWCLVDEQNEIYQNSRCSAIFKIGTEGRAYYLDAIVWKTQDDAGWSGGSTKLKDGTTLRTRQYIKSFPFKPKTFKIDVIETEVAKDDWEFTIKDEKQLEAVFEYYDRYFNLK